MRNYRSICFLNCPSKLFEKVLKLKIWAIIVDKQLLPNCHFCFRAGQGAIHQTASFSNLVKCALSKRESSAMVLLDIEKAFVSLWHIGLIFKLSHYLICLIHCFLSEISLRVVFPKNNRFPLVSPGFGVRSAVVYIVYC